jgi:hypothetical protein
VLSQSRNVFLFSTGAVHAVIVKLHVKIEGFNFFALIIFADLTDATFLPGGTPRSSQPCDSRFNYDYIHTYCMSPISTQKRCKMFYIPFLYLTVY